MRKILQKLGVKPRPTAEVFTEIHQRQLWKGKHSVSGPGSDVEVTRTIAQALPKLLRELGVTSMLDIPCGDFHWMRTVDLSGVAYIGADIVPAIVAANQAFVRPGIEFCRLDLLVDALPKVDLVFCRDCLVHFSLADARRALDNIRASEAKWLLTTTFPATTVNREIKTGQWRALNLELAPFHLPRPARLIAEGYADEAGRYGDKALGLWRVADGR